MCSFVHEKSVWQKCLVKVLCRFMHCFSLCTHMIWWNRNVFQIAVGPPWECSRFAFKRTRHDKVLSFRFRLGNVKTMDSIDAVIEVVNSVTRGVVQDRHLYVLVTLDVRNAFNLITWLLLSAAVAVRSFGLPPYLRQIFRFYMSDWVVMVPEGGDNVKISMTYSTRFGVRVNPVEHVLRCPLGHAASLLGFADDVALVVVSHTTEGVECALKSYQRGWADMDWYLHIAKLKWSCWLTNEPTANLSYFTADKGCPLGGPLNIWELFWTRNLPSQVISGQHLRRWSHRERQLVVWCRM